MKHSTSIFCNAFLCLTVLFVALSPNAAQADLTGIWRTEPGDNGGFGDIQIYKCGKSYCGVVLKSYGAAAFIPRGKRIIRGLKKEGSAYTGGEVYAVKYKTWMRLNVNETASVGAKATGCYGPVCKSQGWKRLK